LIASSLPVGIHTFAAKYSGNTVYSPQTSNTITVEVKKNETSILNIDNRSFKIINVDHKTYLKGTKPGDEVFLFDTSGQLTKHFKAASDIALVNKSGIVLIKIKSGDKQYVVKTFAEQ